MNNLHKLLCDALEGVLYENDSAVLCRDMDYGVDTKYPRIQVTVLLKTDADKRERNSMAIIIKRLVLLRDALKSNPNANTSENQKQMKH